MKIKNLLISGCLLTALSFNFTSCDFLLTEPQDFVDPDKFYSNEEECKYAMSGIYLSLARQGAYGDSYAIKMTGADDLSFFCTSDSKKQENPSLNGHNPSTVDISKAWNAFYEGINNANVFLERVENSPLEDAIKAKYIGEARFLRAYYHFLLAQGWYNVPVRTESIKDINSPMLEATPHLKALDWIIGEMVAALDKVDDELFDKSPSRVKKTTVAGILARVYLWKAGYNNYRFDTDPELSDEEIKACYTEASKYAKLVIDSGKHKLIATEDPADPYAVPENIYLQWQNMANDKYDEKYNESMWEVEFMGNRQGGTWTEGAIGSFIGNYQVTPTLNHYLGYASTYYKGTGKLYQLLTENPYDLRKDLALAPYTWKSKKVNVTDAEGNVTEEKVFGKWDHDKTVHTGRYCGKYRREWEQATVKSKVYTACNYPILRYADVLLMYAEAEYGKMNFTGALSGEALARLNEVRTRAIPVSKDPDAAFLGTEEDFYQKIKDERGRELCFESLRRFDLIRWGEYAGKEKNIKKTFEHDLALTDGPAKWDKDDSARAAAQYMLDMTEPEKHRFFPIPTSELNVNSKMHQNPLW